MNTKLLKLFFVALLLITVTSVTAHSFAVGGIYYNIISSTARTVEVAYKGSSPSAYSNEYSGSVSIPSTVRYSGTTYRVTSISYHAFYNCTGLTSVTIPNSVTSISDYAFYGCRSLTSVTIPNSVTSISDHAFYNCTGLTSVTIPNSVTSIGDYAFYNCTGLTSVTIPNSVTSISDYAFYGCRSLTSVTIPNSVTSIGYHAFEGCTGLTSVTIPNSVTSISHYAFSYCTGLTSVTIPNSVTHIGTYAFSSCTGLTSVTIPNSVTHIGIYAFSSCTGLTSVTIPNSVTSISAYAFYGCRSLTAVHVSDLTAWCKINFGYIYANPLFYAKNLYLNGEKVTDLVIPDGVTSISNYAFYNCTGLTSVTIPGSVTSIGEGAFSDCTSLASVTIDEGVTSIGSSAFSYCTGLTSVTIPNSVTSIGYKAFYNCTGLTEIYVESSTPATIDRYTFDGLYEQATLYVPAGAKAAYEAAAYWTNFTIVEQTTTLLGDINSDNKVDVGDVTILIGMILDASLLTDSGDINGDNKVDVGDVTTLLAIILGTNNTPARAVAMEEYNVELSVEGDEQSLTIDATATDYPYSAVQFDVYLPAGVKAIGNMVVGCGNAAAYKEQADGAVRVVIYSPSNTAIANKSASIAIDATGLALGSHPVEVKNIILAAPGRAKAIAWDSTGYITIAGTTGIDGVVSDAGNADAVVYDLQGHRVTEIVKGRVYIKNGSKFIAQ